MKIGIVGPFNPAEFKDYFPNTEVPYMNINASSVQALVMSFVENGHEVSVFTINEKNIYEEFLSNNLKIYTVPYRLIPRTGIFQIYKVKQLRKAIKKHLPELDVLHAQWTYEYAYAAKAFVREIPVFCTVRDWCPYIMSVVCRTMIGKIGWSIKYIMFRQVMASGNIHFIANSEYTKTRILSDYLNKDVTLIPNSIKKEYILTNRERTCGEIRLITIANGIFDPRKNIINLLRAFKLLKLDYPEASLTIVGKYSEETPTYVQWKDEGLLEGVTITGQLSHEEVIAQIDNSTILVHPSLEETFGNILLEAMARCVPVIGGVESGAVPMVLGHGKYGVCCDVLSPEEIKKSVIHLLDVDNCKKITNCATIQLLETYSSDIICERHVNEFMKYMKNRRL